MNRVKAYHKICFPSTIVELPYRGVQVQEPNPGKEWEGFEGRKTVIFSQKPGSIEADIQVLEYIYT